jgi:hypothetical protein
VEHPGLLALPTNIRLRCTSLMLTKTKTNTLAYYGKELFTAVENLMVQPPGANYKTFLSVIYKICNKLVPDKLFLLSLIFARSARVYCSCSTLG